MSTDTPDCEHILHDNGIHEFIFHKSTRKAVDIQLNIMQDVRDSTAPHEKIYLLTDFRPGGMPPFRYALQKTKILNQRYDIQHSMKQAYLNKPGPLIEIARTFLNTIFPNSGVRFFGEHERDAALAWLIAEKEGIQPKTEIK